MAERQRQQQPPQRRRSVAVAWATLGPVLLLAVVACAGPRTVTVVSYNTQNLFDGNDDGREYRELSRAGGWTPQLAAAKQRAVAAALARAVPGGADLIALQEVEHAGVVAELHAAHLRGMGYRHLVMVPQRDASVGVAVLSKLPVRRVGVIQVAAPRPGCCAGLRHIVEVEVALGTGQSAPILHLFNNHWRSRRGGAQSSNPQRLQAAAALAARLRELHASDPGAELLVVGDLNQTAAELAGWSRQPTGSAPLLVRDLTAAVATAPPPSVSPASAPVLLHSPWLGPASDRSGPAASYHHGGSWQTLDHMLLSAGLLDPMGATWDGELTVVSDGLLDGRGRPRRFQRGPPARGTSDHLPLLISLSVIRHTADRRAGL